MPVSTEAYKKDLKNRLVHHPELTAALDPVAEAVDQIIKTFRADGQLLIGGNGGSAADAEHWSGELLKGFYLSRPLTDKQRAALSPDLADRLQNGLRAIPLTSFPILRTATLNDQGPNMDFAQLVWALGRPGDMLVAISTSGNAENLRLAAEAAHGKDMQVIALTGRGGGNLRECADIWIGVPAEQTHLIQELHLALYHAICLTVETTMFEG